MNDTEHTVECPDCKTLIKQPFFTVQEFCDKCQKFFGNGIYYREKPMTQPDKQGVFTCLKCGDSFRAPLDGSEHECHLCKNKYFCIEIAKGVTIDPGGYRKTTCSNCNDLQFINTQSIFNFCTKCNHYLGQPLSIDAAMEAEPTIQPDNSHYTGGIQPFEYIRANNLDFFEGNVVKYVTRWRKKGGVEDLMKAKVYIEELINQARQL